MKKRFRFILICTMLLTACSSEKKDPLLETTNQTSISSNTTPNTQGTTAIEPLSHEEILRLCDSFSMEVSYCGDGSEILSLNDNETTHYIKFIPQKMANGHYEFFRKLTPSPNIIYKKEGRVEVPVKINDSGDDRFTVQLDYSVSAGQIVLEKKTFTLVKKEDIDFNQMYEALGLEGQEEYRKSLVLDENLSNEASLSFLRDCVYAGNIDALHEIYRRTPEEDIENKEKLALAVSRGSQSPTPLPDTNPYKSEIFYGESTKEFPQKDTLALVAKSLQINESIEALGAQIVEPNCDWDTIQAIPNLGEYPYRDGYWMYSQNHDKSNELFEFDLDKDGLQEILIFLPGGTMGNAYWVILHLDASGCLTDIQEDNGMQGMTLYRYKEEYFFLSRMIDFNDKQLLGWDMYALSPLGEVYQASFYLEKIYSEIVFKDNFMKEEPSFYSDYLDYSIDTFIDEYKGYSDQPIGNGIEPSEDIRALLDLFQESGGYYGTMDFNNDGIDDWTKVYLFFPSNTYPYDCTYTFVDGKTKEVLKFSNDYRGILYPLCRIIPYRVYDKNLFILVFNGYGNYIVKLIEIQGRKPIELKNWFVSVKNRILIDTILNK